MPARDPLAIQVQATLEDLIQVQEALDAAPLNERLRNRIAIDLTDAFREPREELEALELAAGEPVQTGWKRYREAQERLAPILVQCLALLQASHGRSSEVDVDLCDLADALLEDVAARAGVTWGRFTIVSDREFLGSVAEVVRLRFPEVSVWSLPIAAHELGHFVAPGLRTVDLDGRRQPFEELLAAAPDPPARGRRFEYVADVFATCMVGPCFPLACVLLRFDPGAAAKTPWSDHPSDSRRLAAMLHVLDRIDDGTGQYAPALERLRELWQAAGGDLAQPPAEDGIDEIFDRFGDLLPSDAPYRGWHRVDGLARTLVDERLRLPVASSVDPWDVINAAWWCRVEYFEGNVYDARALGERAFGLCRDALVHAGRLPGV